MMNFDLNAIFRTLFSRAEMRNQELDVRLSNPRYARNIRNIQTASLIKLLFRSYQSIISSPHRTHPFREGKKLRLSILRGPARNQRFQREPGVRPNFKYFTISILAASKYLFFFPKLSKSHSFDQSARISQALVASSLESYLHL